MYRRFVDPPVDPLTDFPRDSFSVFLLDPVTHERLLPPPGQPPEAFNEFFFLDNTGLVDYSPVYVSVTDPDADGVRTVTLDISLLPGLRSVHLEFGLAGGPDGFTTFAVLDDIVVTRLCNEAADCADGNDCTADLCNASGVCEDPNEPVGTPCGDPTDTICDRPDTCDGSGDCLANYEPATTECRPATSECDWAEFCTGADAGCPADAYEPDGTPCADEQFCNGEETCQSGECEETDLPCTDLAHCDEQRDICLACIHDDECGDGDSCTTDACIQHECVNTPAPDCESCGDLDNDGDVDGDDFAVLLATFGRSFGDPRFNEEADLDGDGTVTLVDYQLWLACYRAFIGEPDGDVPTPGIRGDFDADGDVDLTDLADFQLCISPPPGMSLACVLKFDFDEDQNIDLDDFALFSAVFSEP